MEGYITFAEAYKQGEIKIGDYIGYKPDRKQTSLNYEETGWQLERQILDTENLVWRFSGIRNNKVMLISEDATKSKITLKGEIGYEKGPRTLKKLCEELYSCEALGAKATCLTESGYKSLQYYLRKGTRSFYWLASKERNIEKFLRVIVRYDGDSFIGGWKLVDFKGKEYIHSLGVRPVVYLPSNIMIDGQMRIIMPKNYDEEDFDLHYHTKEQLEKLIKEKEEELNKLKAALEKMY